MANPSQQALRYYELIRQGRSPQEAFQEAFPNGIPTAEDRAKAAAKDQQKQAMGAIGGTLAGALGTSYLVNKVPEWIAGEAVKDAAISAGSSAAGTGGAAASAGSGAGGVGAVGLEAGASSAPSLAAPSVAPVAPGAGAASVGSAGAGAPAGAPVGAAGVPMAVPLMALAIALGPKWAPGVAKQGEKFSQKLLGREDYNRDFDLNDAISSKALASQLPGFAELPEEERARQVQALLESGLLTAGRPLMNKDTGEELAHTQWQIHPSVGAGPRRFDNVGSVADMGRFHDMGANSRVQSALTKGPSSMVEPGSPTLHLPEHIRPVMNRPSEFTPEQIARLNQQWGSPQIAGGGLHNLQKPENTTLMPDPGFTGNLQQTINLPEHIRPVMNRPSEFTPEQIARLNQQWGSPLVRALGGRA